MITSPRFPRAGSRPFSRLCSRTVGLLAAAVLAGAALSACGTVSSPGAAFSVNGVDYSRDDFNALAAALIEAGQFQVAPGAEEISTADARVVLKELIRLESFNQLAARENLVIDPALRQQAVDEASKDPAFAGYSEQLKELLLDLTVAGQAVGGLKMPDTFADLKAEYTESPARLGVMCLSHILVETEADARKVLAELDAGAGFAEMAKKYSTEPGADQSGGALTNEGVACGSLGSLQDAFDRDFMAGAIEAKTGVPSGPVKTQFGWHIILSRPADEIGDDLVKAASGNPGMDMLQGFMTTADITVASVYGRWDPAVANIV